MNKVLICYLFLALVVTALMILAFNGSYFPHLQVDVVVFYNRANFFLQNLSLEKLKDNEYQPGALLFFFSLSPVLLISDSFDQFKLALFTVNMLFIFSLAIIYHKFSKVESVFLFSLILLFTGPIVMFRFDLLAVLLVNISLYLWVKNKKAFSVIILSLATQVKIYPILFLPYLLFLSYKNEGIKQSAKDLLIYLASTEAFLILYVFFLNAQVSDIFESLNFHALKPLGIESVFASFVLMSNILQGKLPALVGDYGIWGISSENIFFPMWLFNYLWIIPFSLLHLLLLKVKSRPAFDLRFCLVNILLFLVFSKVLSHQYLLWFLLLVPLLDTIYVRKTFWIINIFLILLITLLSQAVYPLNYSELLNELTGKSDLSLVFYLTVARSILLVSLLANLAVDWIKHPHDSHLAKDGGAASEEKSFS